MQLHALRWWRRVVEGFRHDRMREAQLTRRPRDDETGLDRGLESLDDVRAAHVGHQIQRKIATHHSRKGQDRATFLRQPPGPAEHDLTDVTRHREPVADLGQATIGREHARDLTDVERVAFGVRADALDDLLRRGHARRCRDHLADVAPAESGENDPSRHAVAHQLRQRGCEGTVGAELDVPIRHDNEHAQTRDGTSDVLQQQERGFVGGMKVLEHDHDRLLGRRHSQELHHRFEQAETGRLSVLRGRLHRRPLELGEQLPQLVRAGRRPLPNHVAQRRGPRPISGRATQLPTATPRDQRTVRRDTRVAYSSARRDLPIPGSPPSSTNPPRPPAAAVPASCSSPSSWPRPTKRSCIRTGM